MAGTGWARSRQDDGVYFMKISRNKSLCCPLCSIIDRLSYARETGQGLEQKWMLEKGDGWFWVLARLGV
jgi:hypothetical protein